MAQDGWSVALRLVELRIIDQRKIRLPDLPAILTSESIDPPPLAARVAVVPVAPPVARFAGHGREGRARAVVALVVYLQLCVALNAAPDDVVSRAKPVADDDDDALQSSGTDVDPPFGQISS